MSELSLLLCSLSAPRHPLPWWNWVWEPGLLCQWQWLYLAFPRSWPSAIPIPKLGLNSVTTTEPSAKRPCPRNIRVRKAGRGGHCSSQTRSENPPSGPAEKNTRAWSPLRKVAKARAFTDFTYAGVVVKTQFLVLTSFSKEVLCYTTQLGHSAKSPPSQRGQCTSKP